jgi:O-antigen/teichoic acid export membrane protein
MKLPERINAVYRRLGSGMAANAYAQSVTLTIQILSLPILISIWGLEKYGQWIVLTSIQGYFSLTDFGLMAAIMNRLTNMDVQSINRGERTVLYTTSTVFCLAMGTTITAICTAIILWYLLPQSHLTKDAALALILLIAHAQVSLFNTVIDAAFRVQNEYAKGTFALETIRAAEWCFGVTALIMYETMTSLAAGMLTTRVLLIAAAFAFAQQRDYFCKLQRVTPNFKLLLELRESASAWFTVRVTDAIAIQGITLAVAHYFGTVKAAEYNAYRTISRTIVQLTSAISNSAWPTVAREFSNKNISALRELISTNLLIASSSACVLAIAVHFAFPNILARWTRNSIGYEPILELLFLAASFLASISYMARIILMATDNLKPMALSYKVATLLALALVILSAVSTNSLHYTALIVLLAEAATLYVALKTIRRVIK